MRTRTPQTKDAAKGGGYALNKSKQLKQKNDNHVGVPIFLQRFPTKYYQSHVIQKQVEEPENEEGPNYQPKLNIGSPNDEYEKEADLVADRVMRQAESSTVSEDEENQEEMLQSKSLGGKIIQRQTVNDEELTENEQAIVQTKSDRASSSKPTQPVNAAVRSPGIGAPLPRNVRKKVEPVLGTDLSDVKVHNDTSANTAAKSINAKAFTHKNNIWLGSNQSSHDVQLMAHEATHVAQQSSETAGSNQIQRKPQTGTDYKWLEDVTIQGPKGWKYRFRLYETTPDAVNALAAAKNCHVLQPGSAAKISKLYGFSSESYAPLYKPGRFYSLYHLYKGPYLTLETFLGNIERLKEKPLESRLPEEIGVLSFSLSFDIPEGVELKEDISTTTQTTVTITISNFGIELNISPGFRIDAQWPWSDMAWSGLQYDFEKAAVTDIYLKDTQWYALFSGQSIARDTIKNEFFYPLISLTRMRKPGYNPLTDPNIETTLKAIKNKWLAMSSGKEQSNIAGLQNINVSAGIWTRKDIKVTTPQGGISIPAGTSMTITIWVSGVGEQSEEGASKKIDTIAIECCERGGKGIFVLKGDSKVAKLQKVYVNYGGTVKIGMFSLAGGMATAGGVESLIKILAIGTGEVSNIAPTNIRGVVRPKLEQALSKAVVGFIQEHHDVIPGIDLRDILGVNRPKGGSQ